MPHVDLLMSQVGHQIPQVVLQMSQVGLQVPQVGLQMLQVTSGPSNTPCGLLGAHVGLLMPKVDL